MAAETSEEAHTYREQQPNSLNKFIFIHSSFPELASFPLLSAPSPLSQLPPRRHLRMYFLRLFRTAGSLYLVQWDFLHLIGHEKFADAELC